MQPSTDDLINETSGVRRYRYLCADGILGPVSGKIGSLLG